MNIIEVIVLGIIQGLTEFLPISSTGHLTVAGKLMGLISSDHPEQWTAFIAVIQLGTLAAVIIYFWKDIWQIFFSFLSENISKRVKFQNQSFSSKLGWLIIAGTIPVVIIGLSLKHIIEGAFTKNLFVISGSLIVLAIILAIAEKIVNFKKEVEDISLKDAILIGIV